MGKIRVWYGLTQIHILDVQKAGDFTEAFHDFLNPVLREPFEAVHDLMLNGRGCISSNVLSPLGELDSDHPSI